MKISASFLAVMALVSLPFSAASVTGKNVRNLADAPSVKLDFWTSPRYDWDQTAGNKKGINVDAVIILKKVEIGFGPVVEFDMNNYINAGNGVCPKTDADGFKLEKDARDTICEASCINNFRYCEAPATDHKHMKRTMSSVVEESLRRQCIWKTYHDNDNWSDEKKLFEYIERFMARRCDLKGFREDCYVNAYMDAGIEKEAIEACTTGGNGISFKGKIPIFESQIVKQKMAKVDALESLPAVLINGVQVEELTEDAIFTAVCKALPEEDRITACDDLLLDEAMGEEPDPEEEAEEMAEVDEEVVEIGEEMGENEEDVLGLPEVEDDENDEEELGISESTEEAEEEEAEEEEAEDEEGEEEEEEIGLEAMEALEEGVDSIANETDTSSTGPVSDEPSTSPAPSALEEGTSSEAPSPSALEGSNEESVDVETEASVSQMESLNSVGEASEVEKTETEAPTEKELEEPVVSETTPTPPGPGEVGEVVELDSLDLSLVDTAADHLEALQNCEVDTGVLMNKLMAMGSGGQLKQETEDIESDLPLLMTQTCPHDEGVEILHRLRNFHGCAMFDLQQLIETFPSTAVGVALRCANAYSNMTKEEEDSGFIPEACIRTVEASSVLGRGIFGLFLYPDVACPCFEKLGDEIPECTADVWPIPINGALLKTQSCLVGQYCQTIDGLCEDKMTILNDCLPARGTKPKDMQCDEIFDKCAAVYDDIHPMLNSAPLPDACIRIAQGSQFFGTHMVERYDVFRHQCGKNIELWEGHSKVGEFKSFMQEGVNGVDFQSIPFVSGAVGGFLAGVVFTIVFIIVRNIFVCLSNFFGRCCDWICCRKKRNKHPSTKDYASIGTKGEEMEEYRD